MKEITSLSELNKENSILKIGTSTCGPCKIIEENLKTVEPEFPDIEFFIVNAEEVEDVIDEFKVRSVPMTIRFMSGDAVNRRIGLLTVDQLREFLKC